MALKLLSHAEQVAAYLREGLLKRRWTGTMPGVLNLQDELGVNRTTVDIALQLLEKKGLLIPQGVGKPRRISIPRSARSPGTRIGILLFEPEDSQLPEIIELHHRLREDGHEVVMAPKALLSLGMDTEKVKRLLRGIPVDGWVILGAEANVLRWFAEQPVPFIAYHGRATPGVPMARIGVDLELAVSAMLRRLISLGHRRIVILTRSAWPSGIFLREMEAAGIAISSYHCPVLEPGLENFRRTLDSLFAVSPPTALYIDEAPLALAAQSHLARRGILAPRDVSLACIGWHPGFAYTVPEISRVEFDGDALVRRVLRFAMNVERRRKDKTATWVKSKFVEGGTIGPPPSAPVTRKSL
jgi:DNA-binding LacI/PurR family transcriptional regulator